MIINDLDDYYIVFDTKNRNTELDTLANSPILATAISNNNLRAAGYATLMGTYLEWHPK